MIKLSSYAKYCWLGEFGFSSIFIHGRIEVRSGAQPAHPDDAATGTLLARITQNGAVFTPNDRGNGALLFAPSDYNVLSNYGDWYMRGVAAGTPTWWRFMGNYADDGTADTLKERIRMDGPVGANSPLRIVSDSITVPSLVSARFYLQINDI